MSVFKGIVEEIPNISIDRFDGANLLSTSYFLSHCHSDHTRGLCSSDFLSHLKENGFYLYCSEISYHILMNTAICRIKEYVKIVSFRMETIIEVPPSECYDRPQNLTLTVIPAGHCPGSVMFMFESDFGRILYTGDIRVVEGDIKKLKQLLDCDGNVKMIESLYLDTTFLHHHYQYFPPRATSVTKLCELIVDWIYQSSEHYVYIKAPAKHGSEYIFCEIFKRLKIKVHVNLDHYELYRNIPEVEPAITASAGLTQVHACHGKPCSFLSEKMKQGLVRSIKPSAMWFYNRENSDDIVCEIKENISYRVAYSSHSSFSELIDIIKFLNPKRTVPCVIPPNYKMEDVQRVLKCIPESCKSEK